MTPKDKKELLSQLPDEGEFPSDLTARYELLECFDASKEERTLLARDRESGARCVVKCYVAGTALFDRDEPEALRTLQAPPLPRFLAEYRGESMRCVLREYIPGETLAAVAGERDFSEEEIIRIGMQLCDQLAALHGAQPAIIHRDIKPQNVILRPDGEAVLIDFGISRIQSEKETDTVVVGTQGFAPPEQYGFSRTDARSDVYSLGILLNWLLHHTTKVPAKAQSALDKVIRRCTVFDPARRYADVAQVRRSLLQARPAARGKRRWLLAAAVLLFSLAGFFSLRSAPFGRETSVLFAEPLIEEAVRLNLGIDDHTPLTGEMLTQVTAVYVVADRAYADSDSFYPAINRWYTEGKPVRGGIRDLTDLTKLPNLEQVCIVAQELEDISALSELKKLNKVEFKHNYITDISALAGMGRLTSVGINDNPVWDISPLAACPNLAFLDLCDVRSYDPSVIAQLGNFDFLDISNPTESYRWLDGKSILDLRIAWTGLDDLRVLDGVSRLERLEIDHTDVSDLAPLAAHKGLKELKINALPVRDLQVLLELPQLESVTISEEQLPAAEALGAVSFRIDIE